MSEGVREPGQDPIRDSVLAQALLLPVAVDPGHSDQDLKAATDHLIALALPEKGRESRAKAVAEMRGVHESSLADGTLTRFVITATPRAPR